MMRKINRANLSPIPPQWSPRTIPVPPRMVAAAQLLYAQVVDIYTVQLLALMDILPALAPPLRPLQLPVRAVAAARAVVAPTLAAVFHHKCHAHNRALV